ncbi:MAG TPA: hypothetical protein VG206_09085 [Terriglobia bacterium]|nr:hypothetical protein [Terriglobia bacterium]
MNDERPRGLTREVRLHFRDQLREARAAALRDAEDGFREIVFVLERLGVYCCKKIEGLCEYKAAIVDLAEGSLMASEIPNETRKWHSTFEAKYDIIRQGRNEAFHQGVFARHLTLNAVQLGLVLEEGLMSEYDSVRDFMVRDPVCAELWQPVSFIRETMLANSFSYLPVFDGRNRKQWCLVSDFALAQYLRKGTPSKRTLRERLAKPLDEADGVTLLEAQTVQPEDSLQKVLFEDELRENRGTPGEPVLVVSSDEGKQLLGILTPFDLL